MAVDLRWIWSFLFPLLCFSLASEAHITEPPEPNDDFKKRILRYVGFEVGGEQHSVVLPEALDELLAEMDEVLVSAESVGLDPDLTSASVIGEWIRDTVDGVSARYPHIDAAYFRARMEFYVLGIEEPPTSSSILEDLDRFRLAFSALKRSKLSDADKAELGTELFLYLMARTACTGAKRGSISWYSASGRREDVLRTLLESELIQNRVLGEPCQRLLEKPPATIIEVKPNSPG